MLSRLSIRLVVWLGCVGLSLLAVTASAADYCRLLLTTNVAGYAGCCAAIRDMDLRRLGELIDLPTLAVRAPIMCAESGAGATHDWVGVPAAEIVRRVPPSGRPTPTLSAPRFPPSSRCRRA